MLSALLVSVMVAAIEWDEPPKALDGVRRLVVLGDSITYGGGYVTDLETYIRLSHPEFRASFLNLGLPSETVSGLSEPGHAGGAFPRPDLAERLDRILERTRPDLVLACYGMNDGIYHPYSEERFAAFRDGIEHLHDRVLASGAKIIHVTPPVFDPEPIREATLPAGLDEYPRPYVGYDEVLGRYADWLVERRADGWEVIDIHGLLTQHLANERERDPGFRLAADGVHLDATGHWLIARTILAHWGLLDPEDAKTRSIESAIGDESIPRQVLALVRRRQSLLKDAWLTACGHKRPGMVQGKPLVRAVTEALEIDAEIRELIDFGPETGSTSPKS